MLVIDMKHRFKGKKRLKRGILKLLILVIVLIISFLLTFKYLFSKISLKLNNEKFRLFSKRFLWYLFFK